ncbi:MAG: DUF5665 domain-containing protein [Candidatus Dojkabacteria bacterium]|nr:MAG: DUF5665 domain-containing protein [Candidatus Dojkabacteria bacterium]
MKVTSEKKSLKRIAVEGFVGGTAWGLGTVLGAAVLLAIGGLILTQIKTVPIIGKFVYNVIEEVERYQSR